MEQAGILIVEDEAIVAHALRTTLERAGYTVLATAASGPEAVQQAGELWPDLVLMDVVLKGEMSGVEAAGAIQSRFDLPVIFLTAFADDKTLQRARLTRPFGYLLKPIDDRLLHIQIQIALYKHRIERQLQESEKRYRSLFERVPIGLYRSTPTGRIVDANPTLVEMLGYPDLESLLVAGTPAGYVDPTDQQRWQSLAERHGEVWGFEVQWRRQDGTLIWVNDTARAVRDAQGNVLYYDGAVENVTARREAEEVVRHYQERLQEMVRTRTAELEAANESLRVEMASRRRADEALRRSQADWERTFDALHDWVALIDRDGRIVRSNSKAGEFAGVAPAETIGQPCSRLVHHCDSPIAGCPMRRMFQTGRRESMEYQVPGTERWWFITADPVWNDDGAVAGAVHVVRDITGLKQAEQVLIRTERLSAMGKLSASLAHEINNPLQSVLNCLQLVQEELADGENPAAYLQMARDEARRLARTVAQMRDLYRPGPAAKQRTDINLSLEQVIGLTRKQCQESRITLDWLRCAGLPPVFAVPDQVKQVFLNLVINAIEAMPGGGRIEVRTAATDEPAGVRIEVADTGPGIPAEELARLFEPFYSTKPEGTGLGLAISQGIVEQHGGTIQVDSRPGIGCTFTVWLPAAEQGQDQA